MVKIYCQNVAYVVLEVQIKMHRNKNFIFRQILQVCQY